MKRFAVPFSIAFLAVALCSAGLIRGQKAESDNDEMRQIFDEDQKDRDTGTAVRMTLEQMNKMMRNDARHQKRVHELLAEGKLKTGKDFYEAAFIFQHGFKPDDFLLAHILAVVSISKGDTGARWISAATLDRYLHKINQPEVFGTDYSTNDMSSGTFTQEPFNRDLIPGALRKDLCVPSLEQQGKILDSMNKNQMPDIPKVCP